MTAILLVIFKYSILWCLHHCLKSVHIRSFFWSVIFCIRTEYGDLHRKSPYSVQILENADQKKLSIWTIFTQCIYEEVLKTNIYFFVDIPGFDVPNFPNFQVLISKCPKIQMFNKILCYKIMTISISSRIFYWAKVEIKTCFA